MLKILMDIWAAEMTITGQTLLTFLIFNVLCMLLGRFRFCFITALIIVYYLLFFENRQLIERYVSGIGSAGLLIGGGALFLGLAIWSFFIESD